MCEGTGEGMMGITRRIGETDCSGELDRARLRNTVSADALRGACNGSRC